MSTAPIPDWVIKKFSKGKKTWSHQVLVWKEPAKEWHVAGYFTKYLNNKFPGFHFELIKAGEYAEVWCCANHEISMAMVQNIRRAL